MAVEHKRMRQLTATHAEWQAQNPTLLDGEIAFSSDRNQMKVGPGQWGTLPYWAADHGNLTGLSGDDHPQYFNQSRGDARYYTQTYVDSNFAPIVHTHTLSQITDAGSMAAEDDAPQDGNPYVRSNGTWVIGSGGGGVSTFVALTDTPPNYTGHAGKAAIVNGTENGLEFSAIPSAADFVAKSGDVMTGDLSRKSVTSSWPSIKLDGIAGTNRQFSGLTDGVDRWVLVVGNNEAETGSNAGSNFALARFDDAGVFIDTPIYVERDTGTVLINGIPFTAPITEHGDLLGLSDDDHPHYFNQARGDARYLQDAPSDGNQYARQNGTWSIVSGGGGSSTFLGLTDTPASYSGNAGKAVQVNSAGNALEFVVPPAGVTDHGQLNGLGDDDHPHYLTQGRGDARYYTQSQVDSGFAPIIHTHDHGNLNGLGDDDHPQYHNNARGDARYYTQAQVDAAIEDHENDTDNPHQTSWGNLLGVPAEFPPSSHTHVWADITDPPTIITDHGSLNGLGDDDHPQYLNQARGDGRYYTQSELNALLASKVNDTGDTVTGNITRLSSVSGDWPSFVVNGPSGSNRQFVGQTGGGARWVVSVGTNDPETGSNSGSNFAILRHNDAGQFLDAPFKINRSTGTVEINGVAYVPAITDHSGLSGLSDDDHPQYFNEVRGDARYTQFGHQHVEADITDLDKYTQGEVDAALDGKLNLTGGILTGDLTRRSTDTSWPTIKLEGPSGTNRQLVGATGTSARWVMALGNSATEAGSDAGSDFNLARFDDAGTFIDVPFSIDRATGKATFLNEVQTGKSVFIESDNPEGGLFVSSGAGTSTATLKFTDGVNLPTDQRWGFSHVVGGNFNLTRHNSNGDFQDSPIQVNGSTGVVTIKTSAASMARLAAYVEGDGLDVGAALEALLDRIEALENS